MEPIYKSSSYFNFITSLVYRAVCLAGIIYCAPHYKENPPVILIACLVLGFFFLLYGNDEYLVFKDRIEVKTDSLLSLILKKRRELLLNDVAYAFLPEEPKSSPVEIAIVAIMFVLKLFKPIHYSKKLRPIYFAMKDGETKEWQTSLSREEQLRIVQVVNKNTGKQ
jgi:hypothetical protein